MQIQSSSAYYVKMLRPVQNEGSPHQIQNDRHANNAGSTRHNSQMFERSTRHHQLGKFTVSTSTGSMKLSAFLQCYAIGETLLSLLLSLLVLQQQFIMTTATKPLFTATVAANESVTGKNSEHCVMVSGTNNIIKEVGSVWISAENPCAIYACDVNDNGIAQIMKSEDDCNDFYCDVDSELQPKEGTCCGACVRTKCRFNDSVFDVGQTWHNKYDCTLLECTQLPGGQPIINAFQKTCPPLPKDCAPEEIIIEDCCQYCKSSRNRGLGVNRHDDIWTEEFYRNHPCARECKVNEPPRTCHYTFVVEWYETLSKACYNCPQNITDCNRPHCILGDGIPRSVTVVNRMMPGPSLEVCENDIIIVDVRNELLGESTTIHWHGLHQRDTPYMDGVPHISQCPISPHSTFRYTFKAENPGTHFWHSHTGMQRGDGVVGALIIRRPRSVDPHGHLYDFDLTEHKLILQDWVHVPGISMFASHHHSRGDNKPRNLLVNGRGRYYAAIWEMIKKDSRTAAENTKRKIKPVNNNATNNDYTTKATTTATFSSSTEGVSNVDDMNVPSTNPDLNKEVDFLHTLDNGKSLKLHLKGSNEISRLARLVNPADTTTAATTLKEEPSGNKTTKATASPQHTRQKRTVASFNVPLDKMPLQIYNVRRGFRYRFRVINAEFLNCPIVVSIDNHTLTAINSDSYDFEAVEVGSIVTYAGERFDFVVEANQTIGNYWIRLKGLMDCSEKFTSAFQVAILHYDGAGGDDEPNGQLAYQHQPPGIELNAMNRGPGHVDSLTIAELTSLPNYDSTPGLERDLLKPVADYKFFVYYDFYAKDNPNFHNSDYYGFNANLTDAENNRLFTPQLNHISLKFPSLALLSARDQIDESMFCNETSLAAQGIDCRKEFCHCHHMLQVPLNAVVEFILVDEGFTYDANHPFHLHGNAFRVVGLERLGTNVTIEMIKQLDRYNLLRRNLVRPPIKDTVTVPDGGYTIIRFKAYNPGFWLFHCHIEFHAEIGMALILKVGENDEMPPVPKGFPTCSDYMPNSWTEDVISVGTTTHQTHTTTVQSLKDTAVKQASFVTSFILITSLALYSMS